MSSEAKWAWLTPVAATVSAAALEKFGPADPRYGPWVWSIVALIWVCWVVTRKPVIDRLSIWRGKAPMLTHAAVFIVGGAICVLVFHFTAPSSPPTVTARPRLIVDEDVGLTGLLAAGSNVYSVKMESTIRNTGPMAAQRVRVRMGGAPITRLHEFVSGLDTRLGNLVRENGGYFVQAFTLNESLKPEQLAQPDVTALGGAFVLLLTYEDEDGRAYREEQYFTCCQQRQVRHASAEQREILEPLVKAAFP